MSPVRRVQNKPFFAGLWLSSLFNVTMAGLLTLVSFLDVLVVPIGKWQVDQAAPTTYRAQITQDGESSEPFSFLNDNGNSDTRFIIKRGEKIKREVLETSGSSYRIGCSSIPNAPEVYGRFTLWR